MHQYRKCVHKIFEGRQCRLVTRTRTLGAAARSKCCDGGKRRDKQHFSARIFAGEKRSLLYRLGGSLFNFWPSLRSIRPAMEPGTAVYYKKHVAYFCIAAWNILTHFHIIVPCILIPVIFAFRLPFVEPVAFDLASVHVTKMPNMYCSEDGFNRLVQNVQQSCQSWNINVPKDHKVNSKMFVSKRQVQSPWLLVLYLIFCRCQGYLIFSNVADADVFMNTKVRLLAWLPESLFIFFPILMHAF
jgi:hypothetical protein